MGQLRKLPAVSVRGRVVRPETDDYLIYVDRATPTDEETSIACGVSDMKDLLHNRRYGFHPLLWRGQQRKTVYFLLNDTLTISNFIRCGQASGIMELLNGLPKRMQRNLLKNGNEKLLRDAGQSKKIELIKERWWKPFRPSNPPAHSQLGIQLDQ